MTCLMLVSALLFGYLIGAISALMTSAKARQMEFYGTMTKLNTYLENNGIPRALSNQLRAYFRCVADTF